MTKEDQKLLVEEETVAKVTHIFRALSDPTRLQILALLMQGDSCNCELQDALGLPANLLSHHLSILRKADLLESRRDLVDSRWIYYSVNKATLTRWRAWFGKFFDPARIPSAPLLCGPEGGRVTLHSQPVAVTPKAARERLKPL
jgi:ArsR family transcriptional regulator